MSESTTATPRAASTTTALAALDEELADLVDQVVQRHTEGLEAVLDFDRDLQAFLSLSHSASGTTDHHSLMSSQHEALAELALGAQRAMDGIGFDTVGQLMFARALLVGSTLPRDACDALRSACRSFQKHATRGVARSAVQRFELHYQTHQYDAENVLLGVRAAPAVLDGALAPSSFDLMARVREAEQALVAPQLHRELLAWLSLADLDLLSRARALARCAVEAWPTGALVLVPDDAAAGSTVGRLRFGRFSGRRVGLSLGVFTAPAERTDALYELAHVLPGPTANVDRPESVVEGAFSVFRAAEKASARRRLRRFLTLHGYDWHVADLLLERERKPVSGSRQNSTAGAAAAAAAVLSASPARQSPAAATATAAAAAASTATAADSKSALKSALSARYVHALYRNVRVLARMKTKVTAGGDIPERERCFSIVRRAARGAALRMLTYCDACLTELLELGNAASTGASSAAAAAAVSVISSDEDATPIDIGRPLVTRLIDDMLALPRHAAEMDAILDGEIRSASIEHRVALRDLGVRLDAVRSGDAKEQLHTWWMAYVKDSTLAFLRSAGVELEAVGNDYTTRPPTAAELAVIQRNCERLNAILDVEHDAYNTKALLESVCERVYPQINQYVEDALVAVAIALGVAPSSYEREFDAPTLLAELQTHLKESDSSSVATATTANTTSPPPVDEKQAAPPHDDDETSEEQSALSESGNFLLSSQRNSIRRMRRRSIPSLTSGNILSESDKNAISIATALGFSNSSHSASGGSLGSGGSSSFEWCETTLEDVSYLLTMQQLERAGVSAERLGPVPVSGLIIGRMTRYLFEHRTVLELFGGSADEAHAHANAPATAAAAASSTSSTRTVLAGLSLFRRRKNPTRALSSEGAPLSPKSPTSPRSPRTWFTRLPRAPEIPKLVISLDTAPSGGAGGGDDDDDAFASASSESSDESPAQADGSDDSASRHIFRGGSDSSSRSSGPRHSADLASSPHRWQAAQLSARRQSAAPSTDAAAPSEAVRVVEVVRAAALSGSLTSRSSGLSLHRLGKSNER